MTFPTTLRPTLVIDGQHSAAEIEFPPVGSSNTVRVGRDAVLIVSRSAKGFVSYDPAIGYAFVPAECRETAGILTIAFRKV